MAKRVQITKQTTETEQEVEDINVQIDAEAEKLKAETDELLDEIDSLLEEDAEEFVRSYVQKGGE